MRKMTEMSKPDPMPHVGHEHIADGSATVVYLTEPRSVLKVPTLGQLLDSTFKDRQHLLFPWLREQENCMVYAGAGVGKSLFALSAALAVAGGGEFLGWKPQQRTGGGGWRVLYIDGEMHIADIQERSQLLLDAVPGLDGQMVRANLSFLARQHQDPEAEFPLITDASGMRFVRDLVRTGSLDLVILDNFSTLGEVEDENAASSFNPIQQFLLQLKVQGVATMLVHHAGKGGDFRGSSKLAATFETIIRLERLREDAEHGAAQFRVCWDKVRAGGPKRTVREVAAKLISTEQAEGGSKAEWDYEAEGLKRLYDIKEQLEAGAFLTQKEIADYCGVSKPMARKYIDKGVKVGIWTVDQISRSFTRGKWLRSIKKTEAPVRPSTDWQDEALEPESVAGTPVPFSMP